MTLLQMDIGLFWSTAGIVITAVLLFIVVWAANQYEQKLASE